MAPEDASRSLATRRVVVVGASAGIGRAFTERALTDGATVIAAARRKELLDELVSTSATGTAVACDVRTEAGCDALVQAASDLGGVDILLICVGMAPMTLLGDATGEQWENAFRTNVFGVNTVIRRLRPLCDATSIVAVLSSETVGQPRTGLGVYSASKAAVDQLLGIWRAEVPSVRFTQIVVGSTIDTEFGLAFPGDLLGWAMGDWLARGLMPETYLMSADVAETIAGTLATITNLPDVSLDTITIRPASKPEGTPAPLAEGPTP
ncbi:MAG TPA: SDR family oxidoreductase [Mycobacteriales bacterium]|nr:SDR family oxidoreductase [Mycobacteriales bacterium]